MKYRFRLIACLSLVAFFMFGTISSTAAQARKVDNSTGKYADGRGGTYAKPEKTPQMALSADVEVDLGRKRKSCTGVGICKIRPTISGKLMTGGKATITVFNDTMLVRRFSPEEIGDVNQMGNFEIQDLMIRRISPELAKQHFYQNEKLVAVYPVEDDLFMKTTINGKAAVVFLRSGNYKVSKVAEGFVLSR